MKPLADTDKRTAARQAGAQAASLACALLFSLPALALAGWQLPPRLLAGGMASALALAALVPALGLVWLSLRVALDAWIFARWAQRWRAGGHVEADLAALDQRLQTLGRGAPVAGRPLSARLAGTRALLGRLYGCLAVLLLMLALGGMGQG